MAKPPQVAAARKRVVVQRNDDTTATGYASPAGLSREGSLDLLTADGEHKIIEFGNIRCIYFVTDFAQPFELDRKNFLSRPKLQGLWVRLTGIAPNDLLDLLDNGIQITPPNLAGNCQRIFVPRSALAGMTILGVVGIAHRQAPRPPAPPTAQRGLFDTDDS
jgi:hypothetical protein